MRLPSRPHHFECQGVSSFERAARKKEGDINQGMQQPLLD
jgi:hypothetical protein